MMDPIVISSGLRGSIYLQTLGPMLNPGCQDLSDWRWGHFQLLHTCLACRCKWLSLEKKRAGSWRIKVYHLIVWATSDIHERNKSPVQTLHVRHVFISPVQRYIWMSRLTHRCIQIHTVHSVALGNPGKRSSMLVLNVLKRKCLHW